MSRRQPLRRSLVVVFVLVGAAALVAASGVAALFLPGTTAAVEHVADRLDAPAEWGLVGERVTADTWICLGDNPCPSMQRTWSATAVTPSQLDALAEGLSSDFEPATETCGDRAFCSISGTASAGHSEFVVRLSYSPSPKTPDYDVTLSVRPAFHHRVSDDGWPIDPAAAHGLNQSSSAHETRRSGRSA